MENQSLSRVLVEIDLSQHSEFQIGNVFYDFDKLQNSNLFENNDYSDLLKMETITNSILPKEHSNSFEFYAHQGLFYINLEPKSKWTGYINYEPKEVICF